MQEKCFEEFFLRPEKIFFRGTNFCDLKVFMQIAELIWKKMQKKCFLLNLYLSKECDGNKNLLLQKLFL